MRVSISKRRVVRRKTRWTIWWDQEEGPVKGYHEAWVTSHLGVVVEAHPALGAWVGSATPFVAHWAHEHGGGCRLGGAYTEVSYE